MFGPYVCYKRNQLLALQDQAFLALSALASQQGRAGGGLEHFTHTLAGLGRAFEVLVGTNLFADLLTLNHVKSVPGPLVDLKNCTRWTNLFGGDGLLGGLCQLFNGLRVVSQIALAPDEYDGKTLAEV